MLKLRNYLYLPLLLLPALVVAQSPSLRKATMEPAKADNTPDFWHLMSIDQDKVYGTEVIKAYTELLKDKKPKKKVLVAVMDAGIVTNHPDLKGILWTNKREIAGNGIDDDKNGFIDDVHGWNFLGNKNPEKNVMKSIKEGDREYYRLSQLYKGKDTSKLSLADKQYFELAKKDSYLYHAEFNLKNLPQRLRSMDELQADLDKSVGDRVATIADIYQYKVPKGKPEHELLMMSLTNLGKGKQWKQTDSASKLFDDIKRSMKVSAENGYSESLKNASIDYRSLIYEGMPDRKGYRYGNNSLEFAGVDHGTAVTGIIGADRTNGVGAMGIADNVEIMMIRVVLPMGDEYDQDVASGIRYAVDNGADIINMSFGKAISPDKKLVDEAIQYAEKKGVLIVRGAGNVTKNTDVNPFYPTQFYLNGKEAKNVITVGATDLKGKIMGFSNYGKKSVDLFAPGFNIYTTITPAAGTYGKIHGTSMASPIVAGIAALIKSYYPTLRATQIKEILMKTVTKVAPGDAKAGMELSGISVSGGIVNAFEALKMADSIVKKK